MFAQVLAQRGIARPRVGHATSRQEVTHVELVEWTEPPRPTPAFLVELLSDLRRGPAAVMEFLDPREQFVVIAHLFKDMHRSRQLMLTCEAAAPMHGHVHQLS